MVDEPHVALKTILAGSEATAARRRSVGRRQPVVRHCAAGEFVDGDGYALGALFAILPVNATRLVGIPLAEGDVFRGLIEDQLALAAQVVDRRDAGGDITKGFQEENTAEFPAAGRADRVDTSIIRQAAGA